MNPYLQDTGKDFYVIGPGAEVIYLGPFTREKDAQDVVDALRSAYEQGQENIRKGLRELIGVQVVHVGD